MNTLKLIGIAVISLSLLAGCAQTTPRGESDVEEVLVGMDMVRDRTVDSIRDYRIDGWRSVDRYHVILTTGVNEDYLLSFKTPCFGLNSAFAIGFTTTVGGVTKFDKIIVEDAGGIVETCWIEEIVQLRGNTD
jgi:hypothetical protein